MTIYVNNINGTEHQTNRINWVADDIQTNFIEWGWRLGPDNLPSAETDPETFFVSVINGNYSLRQGEDLARGSTYRFKVQDGNGNTSWSYYLDGVYKGEIDHSFSQGSSFTLTETNATCDTAYGHYTYLQNCTTIPCDGNLQQWSNLVCRFDEHPGYVFRKVTNSEHYVESGNGSC